MVEATGFEPVSKHIPQRSMNIVIYSPQFIRLSQQGGYRDPVNGQRDYLHKMRFCQHLFLKKQKKTGVSAENPGQPSGLLTFMPRWQSQAQSQELLLS